MMIFLILFYCGSGYQIVYSVFVTCVYVVFTRPFGYLREVTINYIVTWAMIILF